MTAEEKYGVKVVSEKEYREHVRSTFERSEIPPIPPTPEQMVRRFHVTAGLPVGSCEWELPDCEIQLKLIHEEWKELESAIKKRDDVATLDALCDLTYVLVGLAVRFGWDFDEAFRRVHLSNMTKVYGGCTSFREDGKILKSEKFQPPELKDLV